MCDNIILVEDKTGIKKGRQLTSMFQNDYILRMLEQVSKVIAYLTGLRRAGQHEKADEEVEMAYMQYVGMSGRLFDLIPTENIIELINLSGQDWVRVAIAANIMLEEARGEGLRGEAHQEKIRGKKAYQLMTEAKKHLDADDFASEFLDIERFADYQPMQLDY